MFEGTFALFAQAKFDFGPADVAYVFRRVWAGDDAFPGRSGRVSRREDRRDDSSQRRLRLDGSGHRAAGDGAAKGFRLRLCRAAVSGHGVHRAESFRTRFEARRRAACGRVARRPECGQQSRSSKRTAVGRSALRLADQRAVLVERSRLAGSRAPYRLQRTWTSSARPDSPDDPQRERRLSACDTPRRARVQTRASPATRHTVPTVTQAACAPGAASSVSRTARMRASHGTPTTAVAVADGAVSIRSAFGG